MSESRAASTSSAGAGSGDRQLMPNSIALWATAPVAMGGFQANNCCSSWRNDASQPNTPASSRLPMNREVAGSIASATMARRLSSSPRRRLARSASKLGHSEGGRPNRSMTSC